MLGKGYLCAVVTQDAANWPTPAVMDTTGGSYKTEWIDGRAVSYHNHKEENPVAYGAKLSDAVKHGQAAPASSSSLGSRQESWATPECKNHVGYQVDARGAMWPRLGSQVAGKLNPRWVETLMGLPVGWVMPSCASPVTIEQTSFDSSATESCLPPQSEFFAF